MSKKQKNYGGTVMVKSRAVLLIVLVALNGLLFGCAGHRAQPAWVEGTSKDYPADQYLSGVGQADSRPAA